ncbi:MAG: putative selenate ABC transporter substrate-binding protein [Gammaproteobacteria bacterium]|nr:putative selenate ABC transporter substrate-binding protein [Gammaproteobacteria bacterium]MBU1600455.1 putative selenate ABC transporter substrate-binding protein [Gammaproteobacteria bacterium]MBU2434911.1 putative selenate ABC transporter substrate-binding protein [Gammaproteobacteria bacterium]MBU2448147.1 putative selenate ABC transporter substrate-binding protein [Gammaproteobacteria bacterium]
MKFSTLRRMALKGAVACAAITALPAFAADAILRVSAIPDEAPTELQRKFAPLGKYLEAQTGMKVVFTPVSDYAAVVESLATKKIDLAWLGGFTFVQAKIRTNGTAIPIAQREEDAKFTSKFITADPSIKALADLKGKTFAFGSPSSTSGSLMPRFYLQQAGLNPEKDFKNVAYSGAHDATVAFVAAGKAEAGVLNASVWDKLVQAGKVDTSKVHVFSTTPPYFDYNWTVRGDLDPVVVKKLTDAFLKLDPANPEHKEILALQRAAKFIPTKKENYDGIEKAAHAAGLLK